MRSVDELVNDAVATLCVVGPGEVIRGAEVKAVAAVAVATADVAAALRELKAELTVPATPAGTTAGELRDFQVGVHDLQCGENGCMETTILWNAEGTVREMVAAVGEHRRRYHGAGV